MTQAVDTSDEKIQGYAHPEVVVTTDWLAEHLHDTTVRVIEADEDVLLYEVGHIEGAIKPDWHSDLQDPIERDFVSKADFETLLSQKGIGNDTIVVLYGDKNNWYATYTFWLFKLYGHRDVRVLDGPLSAASALKMSYAGITKGTQALGAAMLLAATRAGTADALLTELKGSQTQMLGWLKRSLSMMPPKAYRWVAEMHEIADFVGEDPAAHELYAGAAHFYEQIAEDFAGEQKEVGALKAFLGKVSNT